MLPSHAHRECRRVLKPHGVLAAWAIPLGSATLEVPAAPAAAAGCQAALHFIHEETLGECWDARKRLCDDMYRGRMSRLVLWVGRGQFLFLRWHVLSQCVA